MVTYFALKSDYLRSFPDCLIESLEARDDSMKPKERRGMQEVMIVGRVLSC